MLSAMEKQLNESQRDALVAAYMQFVGPALNNVGGAPLTPEDLYEYLLLDPEIAEEVTTSRVASAIASIQTYMTRIVNGSEPGFDPVEQSDVDAWRENDDQYAIWAAGAEVQNYAEDYILPTTRLDKSHYFEDLETTLNQNQLDPDRVLDAAMSYLNEFEAVSNLRVLSGHIGSYELEKATYYFVGRTTTKPYQYYWRTMDLSKNRQDYGGNPVTPNCWSDWLPIMLPLTADAVLDNAVRPVFYNQRLYIAWVERNSSPQKDPNGGDTSKYAYRLNFGYKRFDDTWTAPNSTIMMTHETGDADGTETLRDALIIDESSTAFTSGCVNLLAIPDFSDDDGTQEANPYGRLMLGIFVRDFTSGQNAPVIYGYQYCDSAFNSRDLGSSTRATLFASFRDKDNSTNTLQYPLYTRQYTIDHVAAYSDSDTSPVTTGLGANNIHGTNPDDSSYTQAWWKNINTLVSAETGSSSLVYMKGELDLSVDMTLGADFVNEYSFSEAETTVGATCGYGYTNADGQYGFSIRYHDNNTFTFVSAALKHDPAMFGAAHTVADGDNNVLVFGDNGWVAEWLYVSISNGQIGWQDSGNYGDSLDLSGKGIDIDQLKDGTILSSGFDDPADSIGEVHNFDKTTINRNFNCAMRIVGVGIDSGTINGGSTYELTKDSDLAQLSQDFDLTAADFTKQNYLSVCLAISDEKINRNTGDLVSAESVWQWYKVYITSKGASVPTALPQLKSNYDAKLGLAQYLDFCDDSLPAKTRLNTTFVRTLIAEASLGLDSLLDYSLQTALLEAPLEAGGSPEAMDFNGSNGLYFWELFFHMPFLVGWRFANEQQFDDAEQWLHYIFDPAASNKQPAYWNVRPLVQRESQVSFMLQNALDPDTLAYANPEIYQKAVFLAYVSNLVAQGDLWYRQQTRDGLTQARVYYNLAAELLGPRPDVLLSSTWTPQTLDTLSTPPGTLDAPQRIPESPVRAFERSIDLSKADIPALPGQRIGYLQLADNPYFAAPLNALLLAHWDTLDARLYNLRHNLTVDGKPMSLSLYEAPADPIALLVQRAQSGTLVNGIDGEQTVIPPYRFSALLPRVYNAVATLSRFGENLLSLIERGENAGREELQQQQLLDMSSYGITLQNQAISGLAADQLSLTASLAVSQNRYKSYYDLYEEDISSTEQNAMNLQTSAQSFITGAQGMMTGVGALKMVPNIFGTSDGGARYEGAMEAMANILFSTGQVQGVIAERLYTSENYRRRRQDWQIQYQQAQAQVNEVNKQLDALAIRQKAAQTELKRLQAQQTQLQTMLNYLKDDRFTTSSLYQWLNGQLAALYSQLYSSVLAECLSAQACWQYELGDFTTTFIQPGGWNAHYRGLLVGDTLQLNLQQMESAYLARHERRMEIVRTVSLMDVLGASTFSSQLQSGQFTFDLTEELFDQDYPGHYMRQIKSVWISLPTLLGPYQDIKAVLTQTQSSTLLNASLSGVQYLNNPLTGIGDAKIVTNLRPSQQIALSSGLNDAGMFELNFGDERYLPFEGTGAVSSWALKFPRYSKSNGQIAALAALTDVIVHVRYTALDGGESFTQAVEGTLKSQD